MVENAVFFHTSYLANLMKITFLIQDITTSGGTERTTCCIAKELQDRGHDVSIVSVFRNEQTPYYAIAGIPVFYLTNESYTLHQNVPYRLCRVIGMAQKARRCRQLENADIIICQKILASTLAYISGYRNKSIAAEHFTYGIYTPAIRKIRSWLYRRMRAVVTLTDKDRALYLNDCIHEVYYIPNMVSVTPLPYRGADMHRIISVGRLTRQKGYDLLLTALSEIVGEMGGYCVDIYGDGEEKEALETQCRQLGLSDIVHFRGYVNSIEKEYATSAFFILSSRYEGFPMVLLEAAACGLPIIGFDCPEGPAILLKNGGGILVDRENTHALAQAVMRMIKHPELQQQYRSQLKTVVLPYTPHKIGEQWEQLLHSITQNNYITHAKR
jgi:glycosyltransferase involved in cell wall biosynthesis